MGSINYTIMNKDKSYLKSIEHIIVLMVIVIFCLIWITPIIALLVSSFRPMAQLSTTGWWVAFIPPYKFTITNYSDVIAHQGMARSFFNSLMVAIPSTIIPLIVASLAAYAFAWMNFHGKTALFLLIIGLLVIPIQTTLIPNFRLFSKLHINGTLTAVWIIHTAFGTPFAVYLLRNFFATIPGSIFESAYIDGASKFKIFYKFILPLSIPALVSLAVLQFLWTWNDLLVSLVFLGQNMKLATLPLKLAGMMDRYGGQWNLLTSAAFISMILPLAVFFFMHKYLVRGIMAGGVKG